MTHATATTVDAWPYAGVQPRLTTAKTPFNVSRIIQHSLLLCGLFCLNMAGTPGAAAFFLILFAMAARSTPGAFKALMLVGLGISLNQYFVPKSVLWTPTRLALSGFCAAKCFVDVFGGRQRIAIGSYFYALVMFCFASAVCSILSGYYVNIALLKLGNFFAVTTGTLLAVEVIRRRHVDLNSWFMALIGTIVVFGVLAIALGQSSNFLRYRGITDEAMSTTSAFNGAFLHPNSHTGIAAPAFVFLIAAAMFSTYRNRWLCVAMAAVLAVFMMYSQARTSILASLVGLGILALYAKPFRSARGWRLKLNIRRGQVLAIAAMAGAGLAAADLATGGSISRSVIAFTNKSENAETLDAEDMLASREGKIALSWENFLRSPIYGIGFQVSTEESFRQSATLFTAPAEKGFLYTALLEEGGVIGTASFAVFFVLFVTSLLRSRNVPGIAVFVTEFVATTFEVSIFAMGGQGTFFWTFTGAAMMLGDHCWEVDRRRPV